MFQGPIKRKKNSNNFILAKLFIFFLKPLFSFEFREYFFASRVLTIPNKIQKFLFTRKIRIYYPDGLIVIKEE